MAGLKKRNCKNGGKILTNGGKNRARSLEIHCKSKNKSAILVNCVNSKME